ncbi:YeeE/YedE family protein [Limibacillus halophilus]
MDAWLASDAIGDLEKAILGGLAVGLVFGYAAQRSRFCLRSACIEFWRGMPGVKVAIWLLVFGSALLSVQLLVATGYLALASVRQVSTAGTLSGAMIGGLLFGTGMILARGCASRLLVLSGTGNLRALVAGLVVTVVAQASLTGLLSPLREGLSALWVVGPNVRNLALYLPRGGGLLLGAATLLVALYFCARSKPGLLAGLAALWVGGAVALGWAFTYALSQVSFEPLSVGSVTFTGPSADTLMALIYRPTLEPGFGIGLVPGVFMGSFLAALLNREFRIQTFDQESGMTRYLVGASLMGFGGMLAGGCAVGAGVTGGSVLSLTAWVALFSMWLGAGATDLLVDRRREGAAIPALR